MIAVSVAAELADLAPGIDHPRPTDLVDLRHWLDIELEERLQGWDRPGGMLGITKGRIRAALGCPASVLGETTPRLIDEAVTLGTMVDTAASLLMVSDKVPGRAPWLGALVAILTTTEPDVAAHVQAMTISERDDLRTLVEQRCELLRDLLGDLRRCDGTAQERFRVALRGPGVLLSGRADLVLGRRHRSIVEVKSGIARGEQVDELGFYALLASLRDGTAPSAVAVVALGSARIDAHAVTCDLLEATGQRILTAATALVSVDLAVAGGHWPQTDPGPFCSWCAAAPRCPDVADIVLAEQELRRSAARRFDVAALLESAGDDVDMPDDEDGDEPW